MDGLLSLIKKRHVDITEWLQWKSLSWTTVITSCCPGGKWIST